MDRVLVVEEFQISFGGSTEGELIPWSTRLKGYGDSALILNKFLKGGLTFMHSPKKMVSGPKKDLGRNALTPPALRYYELHEQGGQAKF